MSTFSKTAREVEMPNGDIVVLHNAVTENTTSNIKKFKYDDNGHVTESTAANATDLNLNSYSTPTTGTTAIGTSDAVQTAIGKLDHQSQIDQTNILYGLQNGVKNLLNFAGWANGIGVYNGTKSYTDTTFTLTPTAAGATTLYESTYFKEEWRIPVTAGEKYVFSWNTTATSNFAYAQLAPNGQVTSGSEVGILTKKIEYTVPSGVTWLAWRFGIYSSTSTALTISELMICTQDSWDQEPNVYRPFALPNYDLTRLEAEDRASLAEVVDSGAKNLLDLSSTDTSSITKSEAITITRDSANEFTITRAASPTAVQEVKIPIPTSFPTNKYVILSGCPSNGAYATYSVEVWENNTYLSDAGGDYGSGTKEFKFSTTTGRFIRIRFGDNTSFSNLKFKFMCCTKAAFGVSQKFVPFGNDPFYQVPINHNMIYRGRNLGATLTDAQHTALSGGNFTDLYLGDYWTKTVTIPAGTYTGGDGEEVTVPAQTNITLKAVIADFDTFYAGYASSYAGINTHHAAVIVTGFSNVVWNGTNSTAGGYVNSLIHKWLVGSALPQIETWFGSAKVLSHQKLLTNAITGDAASGCAWSSQKISLLSENQMYGSKIWGNSKATNGGYEPGEAFKHLNVFNHIDANLLFGNKNIWLRDIASAVWAASLIYDGRAGGSGALNAGIAPAALILLS